MIEPKTQMTKEEEKTLNAVLALLQLDKRNGLRPPRDNHVVFENGDFEFLPDELQLVSKNLKFYGCDKFKGFTVDEIQSINGCIDFRQCNSISNLPKRIIAAEGYVSLTGPLCKEFPEYIHALTTVRFEKICKAKEMNTTININKNNKYPTRTFEIIHCTKTETINPSFVGEDKFTYIRISSNTNLKSVKFKLKANYITVSNNSKLKSLPDMWESAFKIDISACHSIEQIENLQGSNIVIKNCKALKTLKNIRCKVLRISDCPNLIDIDTKSMKVDSLQIKVNPSKIYERIIIG